MAAGFQIWGDHGYIQVDQDFMNYSLLTKGTLTVTDYSVTTQYASISVNATAPILAIRSTDGNCAIAYGTVSGSTHTWYLSATSTIGITYYVFDQIPNAQAAVGLTVFNGAGRVTFSSDYDPMRIISVNGVPDLGSATSSFNGGWGAPYSGVFAVVLQQSRMVSLSTGNGFQILYGDGVRVDGGSYYTDRTPIFKFPSPGGIGFNENSQPYGGQILLVDVSRL